MKIFLLQTLTNAPADLSMAVASGPPVSTVHPVTLVNVLLDSEEMAEWVANRLKSPQDVNPISTAPIMPNVMRITLVDVGKVSSPTEPFASTSTSVNDNLTSADLRQLAQTPKAATNAFASHP